MNALLSAIFLGDFVYRLVTAPARGTYFSRHFG
jgi:voltage-gated potassium channel